MKILKVLCKALMHLIIWPLFFIGVIVFVALPTFVVSHKYEHIIYPFPVQESAGSGIFFFDFPWVHMLVGLALCIPLSIYFIFHHKALKRTVFSLLFIIPIVILMSVDFYKTTLVRSTDNGCYQQAFGVFKYFDTFKLKECKNLSTLKNEVKQQDDRINRLISNVKSCPQNTVFYEGECVSCDTPKDLVVYDEYEGVVLETMCPNRVTMESYNNHSMVYSFLHKECPNGFGSATVDVMGAEYICSDMNEPEKMHIGKSPILKYECQSVGRSAEDEYCYTLCPDGNFRDENGVCHSCDEDNPIRMYRYSKAKKKVKCPNREFFDDDFDSSYVYYQISDCGPDKFRDSKGKCHPLSNRLKKEWLRSLK